jgi:hypothetical protein
MPLMRAEFAKWSSSDLCRGNVTRLNGVNTFLQKHNLFPVCFTRDIEVRSKRSVPQTSAYIAQDVKGAASTMSSPQTSALR